jgi:hypothetical protein
MKLDIYRNEIRFNSEYCLKNYFLNKVSVTVTEVFINDSDTDSGYESGSEPFTSADGFFISPAFNEHTIPITIFFTIIIRRYLTSIFTTFYIRKV